LEYEALSKNLIRMRCSRLLNRPWGFQEEHMVRDFMGDLSNEYNGTIRGRPEVWPKEIWGAVYRFRNGGSGLTGRKEDFSSGEFSRKADPK
jgi:hypothetical protein